MIRNYKNKAASAALALIGACIPAGATPPEDLAEIRRAFFFREAETPLLLQRYMAENPVSVHLDEARMMLGDWYFFNHDFALARDAYEGIPDGAFSGDTRETLLYRKALCRLKAGFHSDAAPLFAEVSGSAAYGDDARFYLAYIDYLAGNYNEAYDAFVKIKNSGKKGAEAEYYINQIDYLRGDYRKVANTSERLLSGGEVPVEMWAETMRVGGLSFYKLKDYTTARNILQRYADRVGDGAEYSALYALATIYFDEGDFSRALPLFTAVTEFDGQLSQSAWLYIGQILTLRGDSQGAALAFDKAGREGWDPAVAETAAYNYAVSATAGNSLPFADTARVMEEFVDRYPSSPYADGVAAFLVNSYYNMRDYEGALRQIDRMGRPGDAMKETRQKVLYSLGVEQLQKGRLSEAVKNLEEASRPGQPDKATAAQASLWLGEALYARKDYRGAAKAYAEAVNSGLLGDNDAIANYDLGYARMKLKDYKGAELSFRRAIQAGGLTPGQLVDARLRYGDCLYYNGKYAEAMAEFRDIRLGGGQEGAYARMREADLLGREGKVNEKITVLESAAESEDAGIWRNMILGRLADTYHELGDDRKAAALYGRLLDEGDRDADTSQTYLALAATAENMYKSGARAEALAAYRRLEKSGIEDLYPAAVLGIARTSDNPAEIAEYAARAATLPGLTAEEMSEAIYTGAVAGIKLGGAHKDAALESLARLADSPDRHWGAIAAVTRGETLLADGRTDEAEQTLTALVDTGTDDTYWLARGYIALADTYTAQGKDYLARLYVESLRDNYPGREPDILDMIDSRLKK